MKTWLKQNWLIGCIVFVLTISVIVVIYSEREVATLNKWSKLCSKISTTELQVRKALDIKMGDREKEWCRTTFYKFFK